MEVPKLNGKYKKIFPRIKGWKTLISELKRPIVYLAWKVKKTHIKAYHYKSLYFYG